MNIILNSGATLASNSNIKLKWLYFFNPASAPPYSIEDRNLTANFNGDRKSQTEEYDGDVDSNEVEKAVDGNVNKRDKPSRSLWCGYTFYIWSGWILTLVAGVLLTFFTVRYMYSPAKPNITVVTPCGSNYFWHLAPAAGLLSNILTQKLEGRGAAATRVLELPSWIINKTITNGMQEVSDYKRFRLENRLGYSVDLVSLGASITGFKVS